MTALLPRIDREQAQPLIAMFRGLDVVEISERLPVTDIITTISDLGGIEVEPLRLERLRRSVLAAAVEHGYPSPDMATADTRAFEARCARLLHTELDIAPHEAAGEEVWTYLTVCWLMDVAVWRWGANADERRFRGDINRNAFRRLWWRAEVFGPEFELAALGEDEFVNLMERPTIASDRRLTRSIATSFLGRVTDYPGADRMMLMRDTCKHVLRLMPIIEFAALSESEMTELVETVLDAAATGSALAPVVASRPATPPSESVEEVRAVTVPMTTSEMASSDLSADVAELASVAVGIAQRTGRVTSVTLREAASDDLEIADARRILQALVKRGELRQRGRTRGTYYVMPGEGADDTEGVDASDADSPSDDEIAAASVANEAAAAATADRSVPAVGGESQPPPTRAPASPPSWPPPARPKRPTITPAAATQALRRLLGR